MNTPATPTQDHPAQTLAARLDAILTALTAVLFVSLKTLITIPLCNRISRARQRLVTLLAHLAAGRTPRACPPRPGRKGGPSPTAYIPQGRAWVFHALHNDARRHEIAVHASQLESLLHDPATQALLSSAPPAALNSLARTLRPLCRMLGVTLPPVLRPAPLIPSAPRPLRRKPGRPAAAPPPATADRPLPAYVRAAVRAWRRTTA